MSKPFDFLVDGPKLKPCPFCGAEAAIDSTNDYHSVYCPNESCGIDSRVTEYDDPELAFAAWNKRAGEERLEAEVGRLKEDNACLRVGDWVPLSEKNRLQAEIAKLKAVLDKCWEDNDAVLLAKIDALEAALENVKPYLSRRGMLADDGDAKDLYEQITEVSKGGAS